MASLLRKVFMGILTLILIGLNLYRLYRFEPAYSDPLDQRQLFYAGKLYAEGQDPYSDSLLKERWKLDAPEELQHDLPGGPENFMLYPPMVVSFYSLFSALSWNSWRLFSYMTSFAALALLALLIYRKISSFSAILMMLGVLVFKGFAPSIMLSQPVLIALLFLFLFTLWHGKKTWVAGLFLSLACLKPSLALPFILFLFVSDRRALIYCFGFLLLWQLPFVIHSGTGSLDHILTWVNNMQAQNEVAYSSGHEFLRSNLTGLRTILHQLGLQIPGIIEMIILMLLSLGSLWMYRRKADSSLLIGQLLVIHFLFSYHLFYDLYAFLLILPFLWRLGWPMRLLLIGLCLPWSYVTSINCYPILLTGMGIEMIRHYLKPDAGSPQPAQE